MKAMVLEKAGEPLLVQDVLVPVPAAGQVLIEVSVCGVCRTDLHVVDGELPDAVLPLVPGHQIVGVVVALGEGVRTFSLGDRVGVPWLGATCGHCPYCVAGQENLCDDARFTGYQINGGYAEYVAAEAGFCFHLPAHYSDENIAPLLCAGLIGFRSLRMAGHARRLGFYGFGAAAHILVQLAKQEGREIYAFVKPGDERGKSFARSLGAVWAGGSDEAPPILLDAAIVFAPVGSLVPAALQAVRKGGAVVCAGIHMSDIPSFPYKILWGERKIVSVANLTRQDGRDFFKLAERISLSTAIHSYPLEAANQALTDLREGRFDGAAVLRVAG